MVGQLTALEEQFRQWERTSQRLQRQPAFSFDPDYTFSLLEPVFRELCHGADYEKLCEATQLEFCRLLDKSDSVDYHDCDEYVTELLKLCSEITRECSGLSFGQWKLGDDAQMELRKGWAHFVRLVSLRDYEWEAMMEALSDSTSSDADGVALTKMVRRSVSQKLLVPLQLWAFLLRQKVAATGPAKKHGYV
mmetsp:Transcript_26726/g.50239  ORF Transcript_26726/g.50239 Transcript_26726/m.50239 type:complete len:192 (+) Transcript_26726:73-648(+)